MPPDRPSALVKHRFLAMGTEVTVTIFDVTHSSAEVEDALAGLTRLVSDFGRDAWAWGAGSLGAFNRTLAEGEPVPYPPGLRPLFSRAWSLQQATGGLFEPRLGALVRLWGFDEISRIRKTPPPAAEIDALLENLRTAPAYSGDAHYGPAPGICWDFGGIGKGYIADIALDRLRAHGFTDAMVDAGGNLAVRGSNGERPWRIGIRDPRGDSVTAILAALEVHDEAVMTHGDDQRFFEHGGVRYTHILDPRSGWPARGLRSVTVVHPDAAFADGAGAALFVAGAKSWPSLAKSLGVDRAMAIADDGRIVLTRRLAGRIELRADLDVGIVDTAH